MRKLFHFAVCIALSGCAFASDLAVLRNGFTVRHERREVNGEVTRLFLSTDPNAGYVDVKSAEIARIESEEALPIVATEVAATLPATPAIQPDLDTLIAEAAKKHHLAPEFIRSVIQAESGGNARAVSPKGAQGLMQLMPATAKRLNVTNSFAADQNVDAGARYLRELLEQYNYDPVRALAAYNAGAGAVDHYKGVPPYRETRFYVARIARDFNHRTQSTTLKASASATPAAAKVQPPAPSKTKAAHVVRLAKPAGM